MERVIVMDGFDPKRWLTGRLAWEQLLTRLREDAEKASSPAASMQRAVRPSKARAPRHAMGLPQPKSAA